jgi:tRNA1(Val) A37 N6-methylase TrmN6
MTSLPTEAETTEDTLLGGRLAFRQPRRGYRVAIDPVLLAAAVAAGPDESVLDAGTGSGAAALCLARRLQGCRITGLERDERLLELARANVAANGLGGRVTVLAGDLLAPPPALRGTAFDQVMTNPPFHDAGAVSPPATASGRAAHLASVGLGTWIAACLARLRPQGRLTLVHRADRLDAILAALEGRAGAMIVFPLWPRAGVPARRVLVRASKGARGPLRLAAGLVLHDARGHFTPAASAILRDAAPLPLDT